MAALRLTSSLILSLLFDWGDDSQAVAGSYQTHELVKQNACQKYSLTVATAHAHLSTTEIVRRKSDIIALERSPSVEEIIRRITTCPVAKWTSRSSSHAACAGTVAALIYSAILG